MLFFLLQVITVVIFAVAKFCPYPFSYHEIGHVACTEEVQDGGRCYRFVRSQEFRAKVCHGVHQEGKQFWLVFLVLEVAHYLVVRDVFGRWFPCITADHKPVLSDEFLLEVQGMKHQNIALELLKKILNDELKIRTKTNLVKSRKLLEMLQSAIKRYQNNLLTTAEIIQELIRIAKDIKESDKEGERLGLSTEEVAFYNALEVNESAVQVLGDEILKEIAKEIAGKVRANTTIDWTIRESARARLMVIVRRTLNKYGYPPDMQLKAVETVMRQAELMAGGIVE